MESLIVGSIVKVSLLLLVAFGLTAALRDASAAARHAIWSAALVGVIVVPLLTIAVPWRMGVLPAEWGPSAPDPAGAPSAAELSETPKTEADPHGVARDRRRHARLRAVEDGRPEPVPSRDASATLATPGARRSTRGSRSGPDPGADSLRHGVDWGARPAAEPLWGRRGCASCRVTERLDLRTPVRVVRGAAAMPVTCGGRWRPRGRPPMSLRKLSRSGRRGRLARTSLVAHPTRRLTTHLISWVPSALSVPSVWSGSRRAACGMRASGVATNVLGAGSWPPSTPRTPPRHLARGVAGARRPRRPDGPEVELRRAAPGDPRAERGSAGADRTQEGGGRRRPRPRRAAAGRDGAGENRPLDDRRSVPFG